jgi:GNAT superfamily N-acetyltransferase
MLSLRLMNDADVPLGMRLKSQAGWNQIEADWRRMLAMQPDGCFVAEWNGVPAGTVATCIFDSVAWIAMMLVDEPLRGKGIGRALMEQALAFLDSRHMRTVRLDATPLGQPLYEKLGFVAEYSLARYAGTPSGAGSSPGVRLATLADHDAIVELDRAATATNRRKLLSRLLCERPASVVYDRGGLCGYLLTRAGAHAVQIGPCIADDRAGPLLAADAFSRHAGQPVYIDVPVEHEPATALARQHGLSIQRQLLRMCRGETINDQRRRIWASSGPELG